MAVLSFALGPEDAGKTLAAALRARMPDASWSRVRELCSTGRVRVDGDEQLDAHVRVRGGESIEVEPEARKRTRGVLDPRDVLHLDDDVIVVNKRPNTMTVPFEDGDRDTLADQVRAFLLRRERDGRQERAQALDVDVGVVQRLDKDTTGVIVFARRHGAKRALDQQIRAHTAERRYLALVHGHARDATHHSFLVQDRGDGLRGSWGTRRSHEGEPPEDAKESTTHVRVIETLGTRALPASLVECRLETGRQHQIRIHLSEAGHPLIGEPVYIRGFGGPVIEGERTMLHAASLAFRHPRSGELVRFEAPLPRDFEKMLATLRERGPR
ncbi:MAG: RluA family pseudouridine synthase [Deltaproteobacteria bacterium]|nr:RluA family pseudouridine synthase [Deltaproteobacteria bacterium]